MELTSLRTHSGTLCILSLSPNAHRLTMGIPKPTNQHLVIGFESKVDALQIAVIESIKEKNEKADEQELMEVFTRKVGYWRVIMKLVSTTQA